MEPVGEKEYRRVRKVGNSWGVTIPRGYALAMGLLPSDWLELEFDGETIYIRKLRRGELKRRLRT